MGKKCKDIQYTVNFMDNFGKDLCTCVCTCVISWENLIFHNFKLSQYDCGTVSRS